MAFLDSQSLFFVIGSAVILSLLAQVIVHAAIAKSSVIEGKMSGYAAARHVLDGSGLYDVSIEQVPGHQSNHFDTRHNVLQLSPDIYHGRNLAAIGTAAHEAGHAMQKEKRLRLFLFGAQRGRAGGQFWKRRWDPPRNHGSRLSLSPAPLVRNPPIQRLRVFSARQPAG